MASFNCQNFAFVHVAQAQFEHSQGKPVTFVNARTLTVSLSSLWYLTGCWCFFAGNTKKAIYVLQNAIELGAKPKEMLEASLQSMQAGRVNLSGLEDKENVPCEFV